MEKIGIVGPIVVGKTIYFAENIDNFFKEFCEEEVEVNMILTMQAPYEPILEIETEDNFSEGVKNVKGITIKDRTQWSILNEDFREEYHEFMYENIKKYVPKDKIFELRGLIYSNREMLAGQFARFIYEVLNNSRKYGEYDHLFFILDSKIYSQSLHNAMGFFQDLRKYTCRKCGRKRIYGVKIPRIRELPDEAFSKKRERYKNYEGKDNPCNPDYLKRLYEKYEYIKIEPIMGRDDVIFSIYGEDLLSIADIKDLIDVNVLLEKIRKMRKNKGKKEEAGVLKKALNDLGFCLEVKNKSIITKLGLCFLFGFIFCPPVIAHRVEKVSKEVYQVEERKYLKIKDEEFNAWDFIINLPYPLLEKSEEYLRVSEEGELLRKAIEELREKRIFYYRKDQPIRDNTKKLIDSLKRVERYSV